MEDREGFGATSARFGGRGVDGMGGRGRTVGAPWRLPQKYPFKLTFGAPDGVKSSRQAKIKAREQKLGA